MTDREKAFFVLGECKNDISKASQGCFQYGIDISLVKECHDELTKEYVDWLHRTRNRG